MTKTVSPNPEHLLLWLDLETTGGSDQDIVLEVGAMITDWNFELVGNSFQSLVAIPLGFNMDFVVQAVRDMHTANGLWSDLTHAMQEHHLVDEDLELFDVDCPILRANVDDRLWSWISSTTNQYDMDTQGKNLETLNVRLCGSGVSHFDSRFVKKFFPFTWGQLEGFDNDTKPTLDLGVIRRFLKVIGCTELVAPNEFDTEPDLTAHRALDDVSLFIQQAKWYRRRFQYFNDLQRTQYEAIQELLRPGWAQPPKDQ